MRSKSLGYMPALDGLRAVAVGMVFWVHAFPMTTSFPGGLGVDVFFVISGFLITWILLKEVDRSRSIDLKTFYVKRLLRLYPALLLVVLAVVCMYVVYERGIPWERLGYAGIAVAYVSNIFMTVTGEMIDPLSHTWSLAMEEQFYLVWPALLLLMVKAGTPRTWMIAVTSVLGCASLAGWVLMGEDQPYNPLLKAGGLLAGCVLAMVIQRRPWQSTPLAYASVAVFAVTVAAETAGWIGRDASVPVITAALVFIILHAAFGEGPIVRMLSATPLAHLGAISYGIYLWHYPILYILRSFGVGSFVGAGVGLILTLAAAEMSFRFVEKPALRLKERISPTLASKDQGRRVVLEVRDDDNHSVTPSATGA